MTGAKATNGVGDIGGTPVACNETAAEQMLVPCQQIGSEIHAESGDAFIYGGPANDVIFGGAQNDTIILGYGDSWVSGGRGEQCIIGGGGRCLASRVSSSYGEPLYGIAATPVAEINEVISTPGGEDAQVAEINVANSLRYTALLYPYNWNPITWVAPGISNGSPTFATEAETGELSAPPGSPQSFRTRYAHEIIYGGWGNGVIHGGPGQSAISGSDAPSLSYVDNWNMEGKQLNTSAIESDFFHPYNPGTPEGFIPENEIPTTPETGASPLGKSTYFDPLDPRRQVLLNPNGTLCKWGAGYTNATSASCLNWFLNASYEPKFDALMPLDVYWYPGTGDPQEPVSGNKAIFGDLGADWIVAGMGRDRIYGGWGNDVIDLRAQTNGQGGLNNLPVANLNGTYGTPAWESLAFGGAGQDILFAGTGGDRLIDWVGPRNSYYVPFAPYGAPTITRALLPGLATFLYALSKSDGADQVLGLKYGGEKARNGEPFGELGLVLPQDKAWQAQSGPPFNPMPENEAGVAIDVTKTANVRPIDSPGTVTSSISASLSVPPLVNSSDVSSVPILVSGTVGETVTYKLTEGTKTLSGSGTIDGSGSFAVDLNLSSFPDGNITVQVVLSGAGQTTKTLIATISKTPLRRRHRNRRCPPRSRRAT